MQTIEIIPTEYQECLWLVEYLDILQAQKKIGLYTHIPNEDLHEIVERQAEEQAHGCGQRLSRLRDPD